MYGSFDQRGLRVPRMYGGTSGYNTQTQNQYGAHNQGMTNDIGTTRSEQMMQGGMGGMSTAMRADYNTAGTHQQNYRGGQYGSYGNYGYQNQYGAHNQGMTNDIGTTRSEQMMQGGMGGMSTVMRADYNTPGTHQQSYAGGNQYGSYGNYGYQNQYGAHNQGMTNDIGTTRSERMMQGGMGGMSTVMRADYNTPGTHQQSYTGGNQYGSQYGGYGYQNQYGAHNQGMSNDIGTTRSEQMMQGGMGGMSTVMRADYNTPGTHQQRYTGGSQYGSQYGGYGNYGYQNQYGAHSQGMTNDIGTTRSEQSMQGGMGGMSTVMRADYNTPGTHQQNYTGGSQYGSQYGGYGNYGYQNQYGAHSQGMTNDIGTTRSEQSMQGGMGGMSTAVSADYNTAGTHQQSYTGSTQYGGQNTNTQYSQGMYGGGSYGQYGMQSSTMGNQGTYNPGDTAIERQAKQNMGVSGNMGGSYGNEF